MSTSIVKVLTGHYMIKTKKGFKSGIYESETAARLALQCKDEELRALQELVNPNGVLSEPMVRSLIL